MGPQAAFVFVMATFVATMTYVSFHRVVEPTPFPQDDVDDADDSAPRLLADESV